ncbi:hypothetical protein E1B28_013763 [Marasmius oreades]|uniref:Uncharacterized protein n=1 Tax=Marasmius oreades TaxID=181124 RepID=A0A9P7RQE8_9AGAR|nr:uncharacterized protein E1B28_013763 [Marasmius oreades]KAG7087824.1 hypothetical protein E1B28_013763 [Marasmius oreades]
MKIEFLEIKTSIFWEWQQLTLNAQCSFPPFWRSTAHGLDYAEIDQDPARESLWVNFWIKACYRPRLPDSTVPGQSLTYLAKLTSLQPGRRWLQMVQNGCQ